MTAKKASSAPKASIEKRFETASTALQAARVAVGTVIFGQDSVIDNIFVTLLAGGHVLLIGVPGLAKTLMVDTIATVMGLSSNRIQCTPDLMPADILGSEVLEEDGKGKRSFRFIQGPVFTQFLMADEINRASPRTQSALLQAMQEKTVTIGGHTHNLPHPFHVLATQNPLEQEGTYPLPEAQLDRFLMQIDVDYPDEAAERDVIMSTTTNHKTPLKPVLNATDLEEMQTLVRDMPIGDSVVDAALKLVRSLRPSEDNIALINDYVSWPPGPRASQALILASRAKALLDGRTAPSVDDITALALPVLQHRMALNYRARGENITVKDLITRLTDTL